MADDQVPHEIDTGLTWGDCLDALRKNAMHALAIGLPMAFAITQLSLAPQWRDDPALVRGLGLAPSLGSGAVSSVAIAVATALPIGTMAVRGALVSALAAGWLGSLLYRLVLLVLRPLGQSSYFPFLACVASLVATMAPVVQREASVAGGATLAASFVAASWLAARKAPEQHSVAIWMGGLVALAGVESLVAGALAAVAVVATTFVHRDRRHGVLAPALLGFAGIAVLTAVTIVLRPVHSSASLINPSMWGDALVAFQGRSLQTRAVFAWANDLGVIGVSLAALGILACWRFPAARPAALPAALLMAVDLIAPSSPAAAFGSDPWAVARLLATCAMGIPVAFGVVTAARLVRATHAPFAGPAAILVSVFHTALIFISVEESLLRVDRSNQNGGALWTFEAVDRLPQHALVLVRSEPLAWRVMSAQMVAGRRPDLLIVPLPLLSRSSVATSLLRAEPALAPLLRDLSVTGAPSEYALSNLADARPVFVELDPAWDKRLLTHTAPSNLWLRFTAQSFGPSDRKMMSDYPVFDRILSAAIDGEHRDDATAQVLIELTRSRATAATAWNDKEALNRAWERYTAITGENPPQPVPSTTVRSKTGHRVR